MTINEAIRILDPETSREALLPYAYDSHRRHKVVEEACRVVVAELQKRRWISVEDRMPSVGNAVLVIVKHTVLDNWFMYALLCYDTDGSWYQFWGGKPLGVGYQVTHWRPLPEPPEIDVRRDSNDN